MNKIIIATANKDKLFEIKHIWSDLPDIELDWMGNFLDLESPEETGSTIKENAVIKARYVSGLLGIPAAADDTGLFVEYLAGAPGVYSSRYAGPSASYDDNVARLLEELEGISYEKRYAEFRCAVCLSVPGKEDIVTEGIVRGHITDIRRGNMGFGYDPVFEVAGTGKTFAEMQPEEKNSISHRYHAFRKMAERIASDPLVIVPAE